LKQINGPQFQITEHPFIRPYLLSLIGRAAYIQNLSQASRSSCVTMASDGTMDNSRALENVQPAAKQPLDIQSVKQKKFKADDLPLSAAQHAVIDKLLHSFKKKGGFDSVRKQIWADFNDGVCRSLKAAIASFNTLFTSEYCC
jgi:hypothetical protein